MGNFTTPFYNFTINSKELITIISYRPLWETMERKGITQYFLLKSGIDNKTLDSLKKNKNITLLTVEKLCDIIDCSPNDIVEFK
jgi:DNA-binding Xre family transcriptional regulator